ncbi:MAG TPA: class I SAM-dependent rRNA methyltransferase [Bdellovibrionales bacterium]|nr:class I SAM-dependent rRNA methyltransferase [Bdellovibrionales bacterium]
MTVWRLKKGADRRLRQGHPWVFASEIAHSTKEILPGDVVEVRDALDHFLAFGYAHPSSQICFRKLTARVKETDVLSVDFFKRRLRQARDHRARSGWSKFSHRWLYAEADGTPGLIIDLFLTASEGWLAVVQASTAGMDRALPELYEALKSFEHELGLLSVVEAPTSRARQLEGLKVGEKKLVFGQIGELRKRQIVLINGLKLECDFLGGQKTGFFLDQQWNARQLAEMLRAQFAKREEPVRVLDICTYVGQWAAQSAHALRIAETPAHVTLLDVSKDALALAEANLTGLAERVDTLCADALESLGDAPETSFDVVICDPPAFVKKKADMEAGARAYVKLNREALRRVKPGGLMVASSCSGRVTSADWRQILVDAGQKAGRMFQQVALGGHGPDHPLRPEFPEGEYLKCVLGRVDYPF